LKKLWRNEYFQVIIVFGLLALAIFGFWFGLGLVLNTQDPALVVVSGSMCIPYDGACEGWTSWNHPFERTLHKGDLILIQGVNPAELNADYPNSDIIVFHKPSDPSELIVHRIVSEQEVNGTLYFRTKGDGNGNKWPGAPTNGMDDWGGSYPYGVPQSLVVGKVIMRVPWIGHVMLFMRDSFGLPLIILIILILVIAEFVVPVIRRKINELDKRLDSATEKAITCDKRVF
jgi:signal peptidase I